jgi:hypothetical protein
MTYLDFDRLESLDDAAFRAAKPYPWINPAKALTDDGYERLRRTLPHSDRFEQLFGVKRSYGQQSHDRHALDWRPSLDLEQPWRDFVAELHGPRYQAFLRRMFGRGRLALSLHWHYTPRGCSVSPHCDARRKLGSHIFYFNTVEDWDTSWGGETLILDDNGRFDAKSAPRFDDFDRAMPAHSIGNHSLLFARRERSWHGVREIQCPEGSFRKVFIVAINDRLLTSADRTWRRLRGKRVSAY